MTRYFISYTQADRVWAEWIAWQLEDAGHETVLQAWDFPPGSNFVHEMQQAAATADRTVAVLSPAYLTSEFASAEWYAGFRQDSVGAGRRLVPVRVRDCKPEGLLGSIVYVDLVGLDDQAARAALLATANGGARAKPSTPPPFPTDAAARNGEPPPFPEALPRIWRVPHRRNPVFTDREDLLADLELTFSDDEAGVEPVIQVIHGLGGVGKTQIVIEFAYRHAQAYHGVWWIQAEDASSLVADYTSLAQELGLPEVKIQDRATTIEATRQAQAATIEAVRVRLARGAQRWLLVFDNADDPATLNSFIPLTGPGHVLITSRNSNWPAWGRLTLVPVLTSLDAVAFLLKRTRQQDTLTAAVLAEELGHLPLALEQASAYIDARKLTLAGFLHRFRAYHEAVLERGEPTDYPATVATTWELAFQGATQQASGAADVLHLVAFLAPDLIPLEMLTAHAHALPEPLRATWGDAIALDDALTALCRFSLVEMNDEWTMSVHPLVQLVVRNQGTPEDQEARALAAIDFVTSAFPHDPEDVSTWPECERLAVHALAALGHIESLGVIYFDGSGLRSRVGLYLYFRGQLDAARVVLERAFAVAELALDPDHPELATRLANLAAVLLGQSSLDAARALLERAVAIEEKALDPSHPQLAIDLSNLGVVLMQQGDLNGARQRLERALSIHEDTLGTDHPSVAKDLNNLADVLRQLGDLDGAVELLERSLALGEAKFGTNHATVGWRLIRLAGLKRDRGDTNAARQLLARAQTVDEQVLGFAYPQVAEYLDAIAAEYRRIGELAAAQPLLERVLAIKEEFLGPIHREVAIALNNLGALLFELGEPAKSQELLKRALAIREQVLDPSDPELANSFHNLALVTRDLGDMVSARALMERALELWKRRGNQEQMITIMSLAMMEAADGAADSAVRRLRLLLFDLWESGPSYDEGLVFILLARLAEPNREARLRLLAASHAIFEQIGRSEADEAAREINEQAESLSYNQHQVAALMYEVRQQYARDRGRTLMAMAFGPESP